MEEEKQQGSIYKEMASRRSRSEALNALAREQGLETVDDAVPLVEESEELIDPGPAFDLQEVEKEVVSAEGIHSSESFSETTEFPADHEVTPESVTVPAPEEPQEPVELESAGNLEISESDSFDESEIGGQEEDQEQSEDALTTPPTPEALIAESDDLLAEEPRFEPEEEDVKRAAEDLVERIGPVVDIQKLPKTQPSRVMSKVRSEQASQATDAGKGSDLAKNVEAVDTSSDSVPETVEAEESEALPPKKKKKKITLLDSYFKGL